MLPRGANGGRLPETFRFTANRQAAAASGSRFREVQVFGFSPFRPSRRPHSGRRCLRFCWHRLPLTGMAHIHRAVKAAALSAVGRSALLAALLLLAHVTPLHSFASPSRLAGHRRRRVEMAAEPDGDGPPKKGKAFVMAPIDWLNPGAGPHVPLLPHEAKELGGIRSHVEAFARREERVAPLAVLVPSWRRHPLAFGVLRACLTMAGIRTIVATVDDSLWAALYAHSSDQTYGTKGRGAPKGSRKRAPSSADTLKAKKRRRQLFLEALDKAHSSVAAQAHLLAQASVGKGEFAGTVPIILIADSDAGWLCRSLLRARGKRIASTSTTRPFAAPKHSDVAAHDADEADVQESVRGSAGGAAAAAEAEEGEDLLARPGILGSLAAGARRVLGGLKRPASRPSDGAVPGDEGDAAAPAAGDAEESAGLRALAHLTVESLLAEARARISEMREDEEVHWGAPEDADAPRMLHDALEVSALVSVGRFTMGSNAAQTAYLTAATLGEKRIGRKAENAVEKSYDASLGAFRGAAVPAPDGVYVLELQGSRGDAPEAEAGSDRVLMSCMSAELTTPEDLCFLNYEGADASVEQSALRKSTLSQGGDALAEPLAVARWIRRVLENMP